MLYEEINGNLELAMALIFSSYNPCIYCSICRSIISSFVSFFRHRFPRGCHCSTAPPCHLTGPCRCLSPFLKMLFCRKSFLLHLVVAFPERASECPSVPGLSVECPGAIRASGDVGGASGVSAVRGKDGEGRGSAASADCRERDTNTLVSTG